MPSRLAFFISFQIAAASLCGSDPARAESARRASLVSNAGTSEAYYVVFCARKSPNWGPGHAFVVWIRHDADETNVQAQAFGFYPKSEAFGPGRLVGKGAIIDESTKVASTRRALLTHRYVVRVSREAWLESQRAKADWSNAKFRILHNNCTHFVHDVAQRAGLDPPDAETAEKPATYIKRLMAKSPKQQTGPSRPERVAGKATQRRSR